MNLNTVLNCTDAPQPCQFCGETIPPNSDHECNQEKQRSMTPHERAKTVVADLRTLFGAQFAPGDSEFAIYTITTALQSQSNQDELRHREQQSALRTLLAGALREKDAAQAREARLTVELRGVRNQLKSVQGALSDEDFLAARSMLAAVVRRLEGGRV